MPDVKNLWLWGERLHKQDLIDGISAVIGHQMRAAGFVARGGQIIDASIISDLVQFNRRDEN